MVDCLDDLASWFGLGQRQGCVQKRFLGHLEIELFHQFLEAALPHNNVDDLVAAIKDGKINPSQLPVDYVVTADGTKLILNTRTSVALDRAGIPKSEWYGTNQTGQLVPDPPPGVKTFDDLARPQLERNKLPPTGSPDIPKGNR